MHNEVGTCAEILPIHFMDSQINKVHSPTIFCVVLSDLMGFWDASISSSDHTRRHIQNK